MQMWAVNIPPVTQSIGREPRFPWLPAFVWVAATLVTRHGRQCSPSPDEVDSEAAEERGKGRFGPRTFKQNTQAQFYPRNVYCDKLLKQMMFRPKNADNMTNKQHTNCKHSFSTHNNFDEPFWLMTAYYLQISKQVVIKTNHILEAQV